MWPLALALAAPSTRELGVGVQMDLAGQRVPAPKVVARWLWQPLALELTASHSRQTPKPSAVGEALVDAGVRGWPERWVYSRAQLLVDLGVPQVHGIAVGGPHLYGGMELTRAAPLLAGAALEGSAWEMGRPQLELSPVLGAGLQAYLGPVSGRVALLAAWTHAVAGPRSIAPLGSCELLLRF